MRNAETILGIIRERGKQGLPLENIYRLLYNRDLFLRAYARLSKNKGAMTQGTTTETVDGMSLEKIDQLIDELRHEQYRWTPVRRVYIEKKRSAKKRPLGIPTWSDKLLQEVLRSILEAYYEPQFSDRSTVSGLTEAATPRYARLSGNGRAHGGSSRVISHSISTASTIRFCWRS